MVNSARFERNSKKELIGRLSQHLTEESTEEDEPGAGSPETDPSPSKKVKSRPVPARGNSSEVKNGRRILPDADEADDVTKSSNCTGLKKKGFIVFVLMVFIVGTGLGINRYVRSSSEEEELSYIGALPPQKVIETPTRSPYPSAQCTRVADVTTDIGAESYYAVFADSFSVAYAKLPNKTAPFASIVKLLSALVVTDEYELDAEIGLKQEVDDEGNGIDLELGEKVKVRDLLGVALVGSKNDAMYALAQNYPGGENAFVAEMNEKCLTFGMEDTSVVNPIGLDDPDQYSTPRDIAVLMVRAMRDPVISELVALPSYTVVTSAGRQEIVYATNTLLIEVPGVIGGKTGYTADAGLSLVTYVDDDPDFVTVVFDAADRYEASKQLIDAVRVGYACR